MAVTHTEDFSGSSGTLNGTSPTTGSGTWTVNSGNLGSWYIGRDGSGLGSSVGSGNKCAYLNAGSADHYVEMSYLGANASYGAAVRVVTSSNLIALRRWSSTTVDLIKRVGGTLTVVASITGLDTFVAGDIFGLEATGSAPVNVKVFKNGTQIGDSAGYDISDSVFDGVTNVGIWGGSSATASAFDAFEAGTLVSDTLTISVSPASSQILQRPPSGDFSLTLSGTFDGASIDDIEWRLEDEAGSLKTGYDWASASPTIGSGTWSLTVDVPPDTDLGGYILKLRSKVSGSVVASAQTVGFTVGDLWIGIGQSNMGGCFGTGGGTTPSNPNAVYSDDMDVWTTSSIRIAHMLNALATLRGVPQGAVNTAVGTTGIRYHAPAHTSTDGSVSEGTNWPVIEDAVLALGDICGEIRMVGEADAGGALTKTQQKDAMSAIRSGLKTLTGRSDSEFTTLYMITGRNYGGTGNDANWQLVREAQAEWCAATTGAYVAGDAITLSHYDNLHYDDAGYVEMVRRFGRTAAYISGDSAYDARGPLITGASIVGSTVTVTFDLNGSTALTGTGTLDGWEWYNGSSWADATDAARSGNTVTFTAAGATQIRYLYGADPAASNVVRGDVKADAASPDYLPAEPTRAAINVSSVVDLTPDSVSVSVSIDGAVVGATTSVAPADVSVAVSLDSPTIASVSSITPADVSVAVALDAATVDTASSVSPADLSVAVALDAPTIAAVSAVSPADVAVAVTLDAATLSADGDLLPADLSVAVALDSPTLAATTSIAPADVSVAVSLDAAELTSGATVAPADLSVAVTLDSPTIVATSALSPNDMAVVVSLDQAVIGQGGNRPPTRRRMNAGTWNRRIAA